MLELFEYDFMIRTLLVSFMLAIMIPLIGLVMVNRRTSMIGDVLAHTSLAGIAMGLILSINPIIGAIVVCILSAFCVEGIRKKFPHYGDMATAIVMSVGLGIAAILSDFAPGGNSFESYLFGSISSVSTNDVIGVAIVFVVVMAMSIINYGGLLDIAIDVNLARLSGVNINRVNTIFTIFSAITIAMACKVVGALLVSSLIVLPVATALLVSRSYKQNYIISVILGIFYMLAGVVISFYLDLKPGGAIVLNALIGMLLFAIYAKLTRKITQVTAPLPPASNR